MRSGVGKGVVEGERVMEWERTGGRKKWKGQRLVDMEREGEKEGGGREREGEIM